MGELQINRVIHEKKGTANTFCVCSSLPKHIEMPFPFLAFHLLSEKVLDSLVWLQAEEQDTQYAGEHCSSAAGNPVFLRTGLADLLCFCLERR